MATDSLPSKEPTKRSRKRMRDIVAAFQHYVATYSDQEHYDTYGDRTFVLDMIYGIGIALDKDLYSFSTGLDRFKELLRSNYLPDRLPDETPVHQGCQRHLPKGVVHKHQQCTCTPEKASEHAPDPAYCSQCGQEDRHCYCDPSIPPSKVGGGHGN